MSSKKFLAVFVTVVVFLLSLNMVFNYNYDLYGVFDKNFNKYRPCYLNERFSKLDYLVNEGKGKYDTFIFGSSRVQRINPKLFSSKTYNIGYSAGLPFDYLRDLKNLVSSGVKIKKIYLGLDEFAYKRLPSEVNGNVNFVGYGSFSQNLKYKIALLLRFPEKDHLKYAFNKLDVYKLKYNIDIDGSVEDKHEFTDKNIVLEKYVNDEKFKKPTFYPEKNKRTEAVIEEISEFKKICDENNIELVVFLTPTHIISYLGDDITNLNEFKYRLAKVTDFYDFSNINFITKNNYFWSETSHVRTFVADIIVKRLMTGQEEIYNFGNLISKNNVDYYISRYIKEQKEYKKQSNHTQYFPKG